MVVGKIIAIGRLIHVLLVAVHVLEVLQVVGILHRLAIFGVGEVYQDAVTVGFGIGYLPVAHEHHVHTIVHVEAVGVIGISFEQLSVLIGSSVVVFHLVLEDGTHVVETFLNDLV